MAIVIKINNKIIKNYNNNYKINSNNKIRMNIKKIINNNNYKITRIKLNYNNSNNTNYK
jgi:hypothetical protein